MNKSMVKSIGKCDSCGKAIKYGATYQGRIYGYNCFNIVAHDFIKQRDNAVSLEEMNRLADEYGVRSI